MFERFEFSDDGLESDSAFDRVEERVAPMDCLPVRHNGLDFMVTPANAAVRMFFNEGQREYSRLMIYAGDGTAASVKFEDEFLCGLVRGGFPVELPDKPDETDYEFMDGFIAANTADLDTFNGFDETG